MLKLGLSCQWQVLCSIHNIKLMYTYIKNLPLDKKKFSYYFPDCGMILMEDQQMSFPRSLEVELLPTGASGFPQQLDAGGGGRGEDDIGGEVFLVSSLLLTYLQLTWLIFF